MSQGRTLYVMPSTHELSIFLTYALTHHQANGVHNTSFTANILRDLEFEEDHEELKWLSGSLRETFQYFQTKIYLHSFICQL